MRRNRDYHGLGNYSGQETVYKSAEKTPQRLKSAHIGSLRKVTGYPLFVDETPNIQTRQPPAEAVENAMSLALRVYEQNLKKAKDEGADEINHMNSAVEQERVDVKARIKAKEAARQSLKVALEEQIAKDRELKS